MKLVVPAIALNKLQNFYSYGGIYLNWLKKYSALIMGSNCLRDIHIVSIEFCSVCNLNCKYCYLERNQRPAFLDIRIYEKLLKEICENKNYEIKTMEWPISGEFFLHPDYKEIIILTKNYKDNYPNFKPWILFNDNIMLLDEEKIDLIINPGIINQIICSIDGKDKESFEYMRPKAKYETIIKNMNSLIEKNEEAGQPIVIEINQGYDSTCKYKKLDQNLKEIFRKVDHVRTWEPVDWNESFHKEPPTYNPPKGFCSFVFHSVTISSSGAIIKCCMDLKELTKYGDFTKETLESIWHSKSHKGFLKLMLHGKRRLIPGCNKCSIGYTNINNKYDKKKNVELV